MHVCSVDGCERRAEKRGWCGAHYRRWRIHGDTSITKKAANGAGYVQGGYPGHQVDGVRKVDHVSIAEAALGKPLPPGAVVHHIDEDRSNNNKNNLVICPSRAYHNLLHARMRALAASGDPSNRQCRYCKKYDSLRNLRNYQNKTGTFAYWHPDCLRGHARKLREARKA